MYLQAYCCKLNGNGWTSMMSQYQVLWHDADDERGSQSYKNNAVRSFESRMSSITSSCSKVSRLNEG